MSHEPFTFFFLLACLVFSGTSGGPSNLASSFFTSHLLLTFFLLAPRGRPSFPFFSFRERYVFPGTSGHLDIHLLPLIMPWIFRLLWWSEWSSPPLQDLYALPSYPSQYQWCLSFILFLIRLFSRLYLHILSYSAFLISPSSVRLVVPFLSASADGISHGRLCLCVSAFPFMISTLVSLISASTFLHALLFLAQSFDLIAPLCILIRRQWRLSIVVSVALLILGFGSYLNPHPASANGG
jgi:hypothetical protein